MAQWFENEDFWKDYGPIMFDQSRWEEAPVVAGYVKSLSHLSDGDSVLDAGCALGRISVELALLNLKVTGLDIIQCELDAAKESAEAENVQINFLRQDLRTFKTSKKFDSVINLYTSFGYCNSIEEDMLILKNMCRAVKDGGTFIMECISRECAILYFTEGETFFRAGYTVKTHFEVQGLWEGLLSRWQLYKTLENGKESLVRDHTFIQRLYPADFLCKKLLDFGCKEAHAYGDFDLSPYDQNARTMILIGRK